MPTPFVSRFLALALLPALVAALLLLDTGNTQAGLPNFGNCLVPIQQRPIPDFSPDGLTSVITVPPGLGTVADVNICVDIKHTFVGQLFIHIEAGTGFSTTLLILPIGGLGTCSEDDVAATFDDEAIPPRPIPVHVSCPSHPRESPAGQ